MKSFTYNNTKNDWIGVIALETIGGALQPLFSAIKEGDWVGHCVLVAHISWWCTIDDPEHYQNELKKRKKTVLKR
jgi:hypothetical protein